MRIFVLGVGGAGSLLAQLLVRQGHTVWCGDRDPDRARKFLGKKSAIEVKEANARNLWSIVRAARGCNLLVNASPAVFNEIILRAALRLGVHYLDLNSHLNRNPFRPEQFRFQKRFAAKNRAALICTGAAHSQYEDAHRFATLSYSPRGEARASPGLSGCAPGSAVWLTGLPGPQLSELKTNMTGEVVLVTAAQFRG